MGWFTVGGMPCHFSATNSLPTATLDQRSIHTFRWMEPHAVCLQRIPQPSRLPVHWPVATSAGWEENIQPPFPPNVLEKLCQSHVHSLPTFLQTDHQIHDTASRCSAEGSDAYIATRSANRVGALFGVDFHHLYACPHMYTTILFALPYLNNYFRSCLKNKAVYCTEI